MSALHNKKILLGISGGIAAYKSAELCRLLIKQGADVRVVMTPSAEEFIRPLTFQALTGHAVYHQLFDADADNAMDHIELARWADLLLIAPATANSIAHLAEGQAHNLLLSIALAHQGKTALAPAMNQQMYQNDATQHNLATLRQRGLLIWGPEEGEQACGETGPGRMLEPAELCQRIERLFQPGRLAGRKLMISAGPTREAIDPVRYISNRSSGKMGYALARAARDAGADVTLVSGPVAIPPPQRVKVLNCESAQQMLDQVLSQIDQQHIFIACAAVSDYRVDTIAEQKIKKDADNLCLKLVKNTDILSTVTALATRPFCVGFAAETQQLKHYAQAKMQEKNLDMIAANLVGQETGGFEAAENALSVYWPEGSQELTQQPKNLLAEQLIDIICDRFEQSGYANT